MRPQLAVVRAGEPSQITASPPLTPAESPLLGHTAGGSWALSENQFSLMKL